MTMLDTILGCAVLLVCNISLLYAAHLVIRRFYSGAPTAARLAASGTVFYALVIFIFQVLSPFHAIGRTGVAVSGFLIAIIFHRLWGQHRNIRADLEPCTAWMHDGLSSRWSVLIISGGFVVLLSLSRALLLPPMAWDCLTYHLTFAAFWIQKGTLLKFIAPDQIIENAYLPINGELFSSWLILPFHSDLLANTVNFPITLLGGIACYAIAREMGLTRKEAGFAPGLLCFAPVIYAQVTTGYVDNAVFAFCSASVLFTLRYLRNGHLSDALLACTAGGILIGIKYSGVPVAGFALLAIMIKRLLQSRNPGKMCGMFCMSLLLMFSLGGRQYILNSLEAGNPFYPVPVTFFKCELVGGSQKLEQVDAWAADYDASTGQDRLHFWEREYKKLLYLPRAAGPKFLFLLMAASLAPFIRPRHIPVYQWYFLLLSWIVPLVLFYTSSSADYIRKAYWIEGSTRFLSPFIALLTIQGLLLVKRLSKNFEHAGLFLAVLIVWDLFNANKTEPGSVEALYPLLVVLAGVGVIICARGVLRAPDMVSTGTRRLTVYASVTVIFITGCCFLQNLRDNTRYEYYRAQYDYFRVPKIETLVNGWEFLDQPDEKKTIALSVGWDPPGHIWFFYPLMGRRLQNTVLYVSSKYSQEVPARLHKNMLRGKDPVLWHANLRMKKVDYIFLTRPWPEELIWTERNPDIFRPVFADQECKIFQYKRETT